MALVAQRWLRGGSEVAQKWLRAGSELARRWLRGGSGVAWVARGLKTTVFRLEGARRIYGQ